MLYIFNKWEMLCDLSPRKGEPGPQCASVEALAEGLGVSAGIPAKKDWKNAVTFLLMSAPANTLVRDGCQLIFLFPASCF